MKNIPVSFVSLIENGYKPDITSAVTQAGYKGPNNYWEKW